MVNCDSLVFDNSTQPKAVNHRYLCRSFQQSGRDESSHVQPLRNFEVNLHRFYLGPLLNAAGLTNRNTQLVINIGLSAWFFITGLIGTFIVDMVRRRVLFSMLTYHWSNFIDISNICMIPLLALVGILTMRTPLNPF